MSKQLQIFVFLAFIVSIFFIYFTYNKTNNFTIESFSKKHLPTWLDTIPYQHHNKPTEAGFLLGKKLFFDPNLSSNKQVSCATCHLPTLAFSDGLTLSNTGVTQIPLDRHSPALFNLAWSPSFFWDGGVKNLESLSFAPLQHKDEMNMNLDTLVLSLKTNEEYKKMFINAFGEVEISSSYISRAIAQYLRFLLSFQSPYDAYMAGDSSAMSPLALKGLQTYRQKCAACHTEGFFTDFSFHHTGLDTAYSTEKQRFSWGRGRITDLPQDVGKFKTPSLRNIMLTAPYMHDGRFETIQQVFDHYRQGVLLHNNTDTLLLKNNYVGIPLSNDEQVQLIAFFQALTDSFFIKNAVLH